MATLTLTLLRGDKQRFVGVDTVKKGNVLCWAMGVGRVVIDGQTLKPTGRNAAWVLTPESTAALRAHVAQGRVLPVYGEFSAKHMYVHAAWDVRIGSIRRVIRTYTHKNKTVKHAPYWNFGIEDPSAPHFDYTPEGLVPRP